MQTYPKNAQSFNTVSVLSNTGTTSGEFMVHAKGCKKSYADKKKSEYTAFLEIEARSQQDVIMELWDDQIRESWDAQETITTKGEDGQDTTVPNPDYDGSDDYADASYEWLSENSYVGGVNFHTCLAELPVTFEKQKKEKAAAVKKAAKQELATLVAEAAGKAVAELLDANLAETDSELAKSCALITRGFASDEDIRQTVAQWLHGMPTDRERFLKVLPKPDRSDWR